jgi:hypothetical protein
MGLPLETFAETSLFSLEEAMNVDFFPDPAA